MIGGLVQDEEVGLMAAQHGKSHAGLLPSGQARCTSILFSSSSNGTLDGNLNNTNSLGKWVARLLAAAASSHIHTLYGTVKAGNFSSHQRQYTKQETKAFVKNMVGFRDRGLPYSMILIRSGIEISSEYRALLTRQSHLF
jgi:hypothetical protein